MPFQTERNRDFNDTATEIATKRPPLRAVREAVYVFDFEPDLFHAPEPLPPSRRRRIADELESLYWHAYAIVRGWSVARKFVTLFAAAALFGWLAFLMQSMGASKQALTIQSGGVVNNAGKFAAGELPSGQTGPGLKGSQVEGKPSISVAQIEEVLRQYKSPATGKGQIFYDMGVRYGIDPAYALAFFIHESSAGTRGIAVTTKSIGNIRQTSGSGFEGYQGFRKYPTWEAGIEDWYRLIKNLYIQNWKLRTVEAIIPVYAPASDNNNPPVYIDHVNRLVEQWRNKPK